ncbi:MAG: hypothetical protein QM715_20185 [Nibricoccus sp.]
MTNGYGNGLSFWRYYADGSNPGPSVWFGDNGNVGIGTTSPWEKLQVNGNIGLTGGISISAGENASIWPSGHNLFFGGRQEYAHVNYTFRPSWGTPSVTWATIEVQRADQAGNFTTGARIASNGNTYFNGGNVGIGTASPGNTLTIIKSLNTIVDGFSSTPTVLVSGNAINTRADSSVQQLFYLHQPNSGNGGYSKGSAFGIGLSFWEDPGNNYPRTRVDFQTTGRSYDAVDAINTVMSLRDDGNVGIGTTSPSEKLSVNGKIRAKEVIVETTGWSDHVFADSYRLQPLSEVEQHIKTEKHLPGVPSAQEVAEKGVSVGDMQAILLGKIEELTLHVIKQEKRIEALELENSQLKGQSK